MSIGTCSPNREKMEEEKMKLNMRKAISFILTLMLVVSVMPTTFAIGVSDTVEINRHDGNGAVYNQYLHRNVRRP